MKAHSILILPLVMSATARASATEAESFDEDAKLLYRVVACGDESPLPPAIDAAVVEAHCRKLRASMERYRGTYTKASQFIAGELPAGIPRTVVYPFGGGDLISALTTFPDAADFTTLSLEQTGDPRRLRAGISKQSLETSLALVRSMSAGLLHYNDSKTENLQKLQRGEVPGQLSLFLIALATHGFEPVSLRFVRAEPDGSLHALTHDEIGALDLKPGKKVRSAWVSPDFSPAFADSELKFRKRGDPAAVIRTHVHFGADLSNAGFTQSAPLGKLLYNKGKVAAMTKAASYLLWRNGFTNIRDFLLSNADVMVSDSTGVPPNVGIPAGFSFKAYGAFEQPFLSSSPKVAESFRKLFRENTVKPLPFRYGYIDGSPGKHYHMIIMERGERATPTTAATTEAPPTPREPAKPHLEAVARAPAERLPAAPSVDLRSQEVEEDSVVPEETRTSTLVLRDDSGPPRLVTRDELLGGRHLRLITSHGAARIWVPKGYDAKTGGIVVYVHGYFVGADQAFEQHELAAQFSKSRRNAIFIVPDSPASDDEDVFHPELDSMLLEISKLGELQLPKKGPLVAVAHSGGFRTIAEWLENPKLTQIVLLDGLYNQDSAFMSWLAGNRKNHLVLVSVDTYPRARLFEREYRRQRKSSAASMGNLDVIRSPFDHMKLVEAKHTIPVMLGLTTLGEVRSR
ncbi:MAG: hypothetical protein HYV07_28755 [Deltaproteobacteria bacterium]|nr:hypothetical protein [Deltaproteobacteria bacterium]